MSDIEKGVSDVLVRLWRKRDNALEYERKSDIDPRTSDEYLKAQAEIDDYFLPSKKKAQRKKPKKKAYVPDDGWYL